MSNRIPLVIVGGQTGQLVSADTLQLPGSGLSINGVAYAFPASNAAGVLADDGAGTLAWRPARLAVEGTVSTSNNSITTLITLALAANTVYSVEAFVVARRTNAADRAGYVRRCVAYRIAGGAVLQGTVDAGLTRESNGLWDTTLAVSGNNLLLEVTGDTGAAVDWYGLLNYVKVA